jgi:hypothetical protein
MGVEVHVEGQIRYGSMSGFRPAAERYTAYAQAHGYHVPQFLLGLSGKMNTVRLVFRYDDLAQYAEQEAAGLTDPEHGRLAGEMGFVEGTVTFAIYQAT